MRTKNQEIRKQVLKALKKGPLGRGAIAAACGVEGKTLPLKAMVDEGTLIMTGERRLAVYSIVTKPSA